MEMSVRKARAQFAHALAAAERGERVTITKNGRPVAELGPPAVIAPKKKLDWAEMDRVQKELGIPDPEVPLDEEWLRSFNSSDWSEELFGPEYR
jgi:prevent-host-death family protein